VAAHLRAGKKTPDIQQIQAEREYQIVLKRRQSARSVIAHYAATKGWTKEEAAQVIDILGLDKEPGLLGGNAWTGFNNKG